MHCQSDGRFVRQHWKSLHAAAGERDGACSHSKSCHCQRHFPKHWVGSPVSQHRFPWSKICRNDTETLAKKYCSGNCRVQERAHTQNKLNQSWLGTFEIGASWLNPVPAPDGCLGTPGAKRLHLLGDFMLPSGHCRVQSALYFLSITLGSKYIINGSSISPK